MTKRKTTGRVSAKTPIGVCRAFVENSDFLGRFLKRYLHREQDIEDAVQEAFLKAYSAEAEKGEIEQPKAFLFSIAKNIALNELGRKSRQMTAYLEECEQEIGLVEGECRVDEELEAQQTLGLYCEAVATLPETRRRVYLLRKVHGLSQKEIAERLGISLSSVEKHLRAGVVSCLEYVRGHGDAVTLVRPSAVVPMKTVKENQR